MQRFRFMSSHEYTGGKQRETMRDRFSFQLFAKLTWSVGVLTVQMVFMHSLPNMSILRPCTS